VPGIVKANDADIPVVAIDAAPIAGEVVTVVRTDNVAAARLAGQFIGEELDGVGAVLDIRGDLASDVARERDQGFREGLAEFDEIEIVTYETYGWTLNVGGSGASSVIPSSDEGTPTVPAQTVNAIFAAGPDIATGAALYVENAEADTVVVVGVGESKETMQNIRAGILECTVVEYPTRAGAMAIDAMVRYLNGESVPDVIDSGSALITRDNIDTYLASGA
jgi:ribose transport system substrate-binding protein